MILKVGKYGITEIIDSMNFSSKEMVIVSKNILGISR
jgi:trehalose-6-phosphate synthase